MTIKALDERHSASYRAAGLTLLIPQYTHFDLFSTELRDDSQAYYVT
jgi:hypothetical protein